MEGPFCRSHGILRSLVKEQTRGPNGSLAHSPGGTDHSRHRSGYAEAKKYTDGQWDGPYPRLELDVHNTYKLRI